MFYFFYTFILVFPNLNVGHVFNKIPSHSYGHLKSQKKKKQQQQTYGTVFWLFLFWENPIRQHPF